MTASVDVNTLAPRRGLALLLPDHHRRLDGKCRALLACAHGDDTRALVATWHELEVELLDHMTAEEEVVLPSYAMHAPADASRILDDHLRICEVASMLGVDVELHEIRVGRLEQLVEALDAHAKHEDASMYPWAQSNLPQIAQTLLITRIGRWLSAA